MCLVVAQMILGEHIISDNERPTSECDIKEVVRSMFSGIGGAAESKLHVAARRGNHKLVGVRIRILGLIRGLLN